ncbi:MAG TPA: hypothetical protein VFQ63_00450 [Patescibacteria group bacterium]|nr:hypothetical protein [Patescibacteria group bacterium]
MAKNIHVAKIVASSTTAAWAQAYHAGAVSAVISVSPKDEKDETSLAIVGKDLLNTFESEYFPLEEKTLQNITTAVETTYKKSADTHSISFLVAVVIRNMLYLVMAGNGSVYLLRKGRLGTLLEQEEDTPQVISSSGFLEHGDRVVLNTPGFSTHVSKEKLFDTLLANSIDDAAEIFSPEIHSTKEGGAASVLLSYEDETITPTHPAAEEERESEEEPEKPISQTQQQVLQEKSHEIPASSEQRKSLSHRRRLLLTIIGILIIVFVATGALTLYEKQQSEKAQLFASLYTPAEKKYEEGAGLITLNGSLAHDDFLAAQKLLSNAQGKFPKGSKEDQQISQLQAKVADAITQTANVNTVTAEKTTDSPLLTFAASQTAPYVSSDTTNFYTADNSGITQTNIKTTTAKQIIKNVSDWKNIGGFSPYLTNFYVLDKTAGILKYTPSGTKFSKSDYLASGVSPDLSSASSLAIDGSIWVLSGKDILKFTKGKEDGFTITGLDKPFVSPSVITTSVDDDNVYILDNGNSRIVVLSKTGAFIIQYNNNLFKGATQLSVDEKNKKAYVLSGKDVYQISLK